MNTINISEINSNSKVRIELKVPGFQIPNNIRFIDGNLTLNQMEKKAKYGEYVLDRGMSIRNLDKTLIELEKSNPNINSHLVFNLLKTSDKLIKDLEESEINFINIDGLSCYQSATLQAFVHTIFPAAIKFVNEERNKIGKENVRTLDELKNNSLFNNTLIDILKEVIYIQGCGNGGKSKNGCKRYEARKLYEIAPPIFLGGGRQDGRDISKINNIHKNAEDEGKIANEAIKCIFDDLQNNIASPPKRLYDSEYKYFTGKDLVEIIEINKKTIISEVMKIKIEGNDKYHGNLVLKFDSKTLQEPYLDIYQLINECPQIKINNFSKRKLIETSDILFMIVDRFISNKTIKKQFIVCEELYFNNKSGYFNSNINNYNDSFTSFELKSIIFHIFSSEELGHYIAYSKIRGEWYIFNDLKDDYAEKNDPPLNGSLNENIYPVCLYYVKNKNIKKINYNLLSQSEFIQNNSLYSNINPFQLLSIKKEEYQNMTYNYCIKIRQDLIIKKYLEVKKKDKSNKKLLISYFILSNMNKFNSIGDSFNIKEKDPFYYVITNDLCNLKYCYYQNKYILIKKDNFNRSLLHLAVIGEYYQICKFLLENGINFDEPDFFNNTPLYYANNEIEKLLESFGARERKYNYGESFPKGININFNDINKIDMIYNDFLKKKIITKIELIKKNGEVIGKRMIRNKIWPKSYNSISNPVYHGTKFVSMEHILIYGLHTWGEPLNGHINLGIKINGIDNWANSIFVSPSIFYASKYSEILYSEKEEWFIIIEAKINPSKFTMHKSTIYKYNYKIGEPLNLEYRYNSRPYSSIQTYFDENGIETTSLIFVKKRFLDNAKFYYEGSIFENH